MSANSEPTANLRERTRQAMRDEVAAVALRLFAEHGFEAVTATQIAAAAGISPRSFFRYFATKEDVVLGGLTEAGQRVRAALVARPAGEGPWEALRHALRVLVEDPVHPRESLEVIGRMILETPSIQARDLEKHQQWEALLAPEIARRLPAAGETDADERARAVVGAAMACLRIATAAWLRSGGAADPGQILDDLIDTVRAA